MVHLVTSSTHLKCRRKTYVNNMQNRSNSFVRLRMAWRTTVLCLLYLFHLGQCFIIFQSGRIERRITVSTVANNKRINGNDEDGGVNGENLVNGDFYSGNVNKKLVINGDIFARNEVNGYVVQESSGYHRFLNRGRWREWLMRRRQSQEQILNDENEDGYADMRKKRRPYWKKLLWSPISLGKRVLPKNRKEPGTLILVRHGESLWNVNKTFTGWADPDLSEQGVREIEHAARLLLENGYEIDVVFTSRLKRAIRSVWIILQELNEVYLPVFKSWRLNERMYGALTGLSKKELAEQLGHELVQEWRSSLNTRPPALSQRDTHWPGRDRKYADLSNDQIPLTESLLDCMQRTKPVWDQKIKYELEMGRNVMVVAHANTLRGLVKTIDGIGDDEIQDVAIPTGIPIVYKFDKNMKPVPASDRQTLSQIHMSGLFLEKPGLLGEALKREEEWSKQVPGYDSTMARNRRPMTPLERSLYKLKAERDLGQWAGQFIDKNAPVEDDGNDGNRGRPIQLIEDEVWEIGMMDLEQSKLSEFSNKDDDEEESDEEQVQNDEQVPVSANMYSSHPCVKSLPSASVIPGFGNMPTQRESIIVIVRHGKTEHNKLKLFTGWYDAPLAKEGVEEAKEAGRLLRAHGFEFDVVYTSWLSRAMETAWHIIDEMDSLWLPIIKSWRLNERMYGELTCLSKRMVAQRHGDSQFKAWRRGYKIRPPAVSSFSQYYPGNDNRYRKYLNDVRYSVTETLIRSIEKRKFNLYRKLPKTESLKDCMDRTIPYFTERIVPEAISQGKRVLISSSENAIRGLLMHLCNIPEEKITELEIPNGLPIIFDMKSKCVKLLDDGTGRDPLEVYDFGKAASYLFQPCKNEDGSQDEECDIRYMGEGFASGVTVLTPEEQATIDAIKRRPVGVM